MLSRSESRSAGPKIWRVSWIAEKPRQLRPCTRGIKAAVKIHGSAWRFRESLIFHWALKLNKLFRSYSSFFFHHRIIPLSKPQIFPSKWCFLKSSSRLLESLIGQQIDLFPPYCEISAWALCNYLNCFRRCKRNELQSAPEWKYK